ncbi:hypothetical protein BASA50_010735 [Batrachochytrium salamandrivorans]|uniref:Uncharacterized protein n=1 Tax=Batrachochytrium salamandrivorans TaxID=1357716 RepID=A0ABQ8F0G2_9FUNG|nr:hypothetical protein BASA50_010735 [Batrachochytrium salamandrivorans]KAH9274377.1 hypothetical protein BASA83_003375 [Batrachochytrium salamandrivorans]
MKLSAFSLIAMFMVTANAVVIPMDSMDDAPGLVKRQDSGFVLRPTDDPTSVVENKPTPVVSNEPAFTPTEDARIWDTDDSDPVPRPTDDPTSVVENKPTPVVSNTSAFTPTEDARIWPTDDPTPVLRN